MAKFFKRKYEKKLLERALSMSENRNFLIEHLKKEWQEIEKRIERDRRRKELYGLAKEKAEVIGVTLLGMAAVCGVLVIAAVAPNIFSAFGRSTGHRRYFDKKRVQERVYYFKRRGYIETSKNKDDTLEIKLTELGEEQVIKRVLGDFKVLPQGQWDGIWRIVIFDVPEENRWARDGIRQSLQRMGFYQLQKSTFVFPYPCKEEVEFLGRLYDRSNYTRFIETKVISYDGDLRDYFSLKS
ncbi:MAG: hypothetical protein HYZ69_01270 [Candidatus Colwellbacteria bacterium]|nr:hypothetical protein [Candidatus Colwellbacteria bacterium]